MEAGADTVLEMNRKTFEELVRADTVNAPDKFIDTLRALIDAHRVKVEKGSKESAVSAGQGDCVECELREVGKSRLRALRT